MYDLVFCVCVCAKHGNPITLNSNNIGILLNGLNCFLSLLLCKKSEQQKIHFRLFVHHIVLSLTLMAAGSLACLVKCIGAYAICMCGH